MSARTIKRTQMGQVSSTAAGRLRVITEKIDVPSQRNSAFSRAGHFVLLLIPAVIALSVVLWRDGDGTLFQKGFAIFQLILGVGTSLAVVVGIQYAAKKEGKFDPTPRSVTDRVEDSARSHGGYVEYGDVFDAKSEVTGGHPEDMNGMPPPVFPFKTKRGNQLHTLH